MYIISKNKDYYDGVAGTTGVDKTIVFERKEEVFEDRTKFPKPFALNKNGLTYWKTRNPFYDISHYDLKKEVRKYDNCSTFIVGFCGKLYVGWKFRYHNPERRNQFDYNIPEYLIDVVYDFNEALKFLEDKNWRTNIFDNYDSIVKYDALNVFRKLNVPYFIFDVNSLITKHKYKCEPKFIMNPILRDYEFYKVFDTYSAFQEIQMFISGVLGTGEKNIVEVEDKYKIGQHGFDKWSFRRESTKNRKD